MEVKVYINNKKKINFNEKEQKFDVVIIKGDEFANKGVLKVKYDKKIFQLVFDEELERTDRIYVAQEIFYIFATAYYTRDYETKNEFEDFRIVERDIDNNNIIYWFNADSEDMEKGVDCKEFLLFDYLNNENKALLYLDSDSAQLTVDIVGSVMYFEYKFSSKYKDCYEKCNLSYSNYSEQQLDVYKKAVLGFLKKRHCMYLRFLNYYEDESKKFVAFMYDRKKTNELIEAKKSKSDKD